MTDADVEIEKVAYTDNASTRVDLFYSFCTCANRSKQDGVAGQTGLHAYGSLVRGQGGTKIT